MSRGDVLASSSIFFYPAGEPATAVRRTLRDAGLRVFEPSDEAEAIAVLPELQIDLLLIEATTLEQAAEALRTLALDRSASQIPALVVAGYDLRPIEARQLFDLGATDVLFAPHHPTLVIGKIEALLRMQRRIQEIRELSVRDELTGLYNRRFFFERMEQEVARTRRTGHGLALLLLDVDHFKKVNDTYGHPVGDAVLRTVAQVARQHTRKSDVVARVGGDEFALLLGSNTLAGATVCAEGLRRLLRVTNLELPRDLSVTVSIGIAVYPSLWVSNPLDDLVRVSDEALLRAKTLGRDRIVLAGDASGAGGK